MVNNTENTSKIIASASRWSQLPELAEKYRQLVGENNVCQIFGYGSIIWRHADLKQGASIDLPNENAKINGGLVDMNIYAAGPDEFQGGTGVGLYAGVTMTGKSENKVPGLNVTIAPSEFPKAFRNFVQRELGNPPPGLDLDKLTASDAKEYFASFKGKESDELKLYNPKIIETEVDGEKRHSLFVTTNTDGKFFAKDLSAMQAAYYILDGNGYKRDVNGAATGGPALDYFNKMVTTFRGRGIVHPRLEEIAEQINVVAKYQADMAKLWDPNDATKNVEERCKLISAMEEYAEKHGSNFPFKYAAFDDKDYVNRTPVAQEEVARQNLPADGFLKMKRVETLYESGVLEPFKLPQNSEATRTP